jgi:hypothetical protein
MVLHRYFNVLRILQSYFTLLHSTLIIGPNNIIIKSTVMTYYTHFAVGRRRSYGPPLPTARVCISSRSGSN